MKPLVLVMVIVSVCTLFLNGCGRNPNSPYSDPGAPEHNPRAGAWTVPHSGALPAPTGAPGGDKEFLTGDEGAIVNSKPTPPPERIILGPGKVYEGRTLLI